MGKRAPLDEQPYRPLLDPAVISAALSKTSTPAPAQTQPQARSEISSAQPSPMKVVEISRPEPRKVMELSSSQVAREVLGKEAGEGRAPVVAAEFVEKLDQEKRMLLTRGESAQLDRLVRSLAGRLNSQVKTSHVLRALVALALNAEPELDKRAGEAGVLVRPPNGDAKALQRFEKDIARILADSIRDAGPLR